MPGGEVFQREEIRGDEDGDHPRTLDDGWEDGGK
jgi:hypothetical protein